MVPSLDVRDLPAPEPLARILPAVEALGSGEFLHVVHRREPHCLFDLLEAAGFVHRHSGAAARFDIWIWRRGDMRAQRAVEAEQP